ncbi:MAG: polysaccharide pyruvyl transferase family protein [Lachnospiraceae bacterium]|nr:polysaccharide pyruvyl transferase family protein [Lachnospiraceae bacterium]
MIRKIVISGGWSYGNLGDEIIARCTIELLDKYFPDAIKYYTSYDADNFKKMHDKDSMESVHSIFEKRKYGINDIAACVEKPQNCGIGEFADSMNEETLFIMSGGGYFDGRWENQFAARITELELAKKAGAYTAIIGQSIGPLINKRECELLKDTLNKCDFINVRDESSKNLIQSVLPGKQISCTCDIAITISDFLSVQRTTERSICNLIVQPYTDYVPNGTKVEKNNTLYGKIKKRVLLRQYRYDLAWVKLLRGLCKVPYKLNIILNVQGTKKIENTYFEKYANKLKRLSRCPDIDILNSISVEEFCTRLANADMIVSCKMHPLIISSSYGVKTYALSQHYKIDAYMKWIGREKACCRNNKILPKKLISQLVEESSKKQSISGDMVSVRKKEVYEMLGKLAGMVYDI